MPNLIGPPMLAAIGEFFTIVIVVISVITWIIRAIQGNNQQLPPPVQRPGRRREERDDEIDSFLEQVNRTQQPDRAARAPEARPGESRSTGSQSRDSRNQTQGNRSRKSTTPPPPTPAKQRQPSRPLSESFPAPPGSGRPSESGNSRRPNGQGSNSQGGDLGHGMEQHVKDYMGERMVNSAQKDLGLGPSLSQPAQSPGARQSQPQNIAPTNLGTFRAPPPIPAAQTPAQRAGADSPEAATTARVLARTDNLRQALRNPQMITQAIIVQEILNRPKSLRK